MAHSHDHSPADPVGLVVALSVETAAIVDGLAGQKLWRGSGAALTLNPSPEGTGTLTFHFYWLQLPARAFSRKQLTRYLPLSLREWLPRLSGKGAGG